MKFALLLIFTASSVYADEFKTVNDCVAGRAVQTKQGVTGKVIGINKIVPTLKCNVQMDGTGQTQSFIYWDLSPAGSVTRRPDHVTAGKYSCVTFAGVAGLRNPGRVEVRPLWDVRVTGANSYIGSDDKSGSFTYDAASGKVHFMSGTMKGQTAEYISQGGGQFVYKGENGEVDCGLDKH